MESCYVYSYLILGRVGGFVASFPGFLYREKEQKNDEK